MKKIGLLSDTHDYLDPKLKGFFAPCDEIWHAGDVVSYHILDELQSWKPIRVVYGNACNADVRKDWPLDDRFTCEGVRVWMTHIGGYPGRYSQRVRQELMKEVPDVFICGHSHILKVMRDEKFGHMVINPGAAGNHGFHKVKTAIRLDFASGGLKNLEVIELGMRGRKS